MPGHYRPLPSLHPSSSQSKDAAAREPRASAPERRAQAAQSRYSCRKPKAALLTKVWNPELSTRTPGAVPAPGTCGR